MNDPMRPLDTAQSLAPARRRRGGAIGWIAGSFAERDEALALLQDDGPAEPRDELGIGPLRDVLANAFFPGVTTLQTRAKYFLFVPAMYARIEQDPALRNDAGASMRSLEQQLLEDLLRGPDTDGVIGKRHRRVPQTPASAIYWTGLSTLGIRRFSDGQRRYHGYLETTGTNRRRRLKLDDETEELETPQTWREVPGGVGILDAPDIKLTHDEAELLMRSIEDMTRRAARRDPRSQRSLLCELVDKPFDHRVAFWDLPAVRRSALAELAADAGRLSAAVQGGVTHYNLLCARRHGSKRAVDGWTTGSKTFATDYPAASWSSWDLDEFWRRVGELPGGKAAKQATCEFVSAWVEMLRRDGDRLHLSPRADNLIRSRENTTKRDRERLSSPYAVSGWTPDGVGRGTLDFRWSRASRILRDIQNPTPL